MKKDKAMVEPRGQELIYRYKKNFNIPTNAEVTEEMILRHWELEKRLTKELLASNPENRWEVFERCYSTLYGELEWLNRLIGTDSTIPPSQLYKDWVYLIGQPPKKIYEVGSGKGELITYLASCGFECRATEITRERGQKYVSEHSNLSLGISDGVHLERFEILNSYDVIISDQVIEHLHPGDLYEHLKGVFSILSSGGRYIFATPHRHAGPSDVSRVFKCDKPMGMHLKGYTYQELKELLERAGFKDIYAVLRIPTKITQLFGIYVKPEASRTYLAYLCDVEKLISLLPSQTFRRKAARLLMLRNIFIITQKEWTYEEGD
jgi:2-polyprenyl-3-methyl-5-hydroxy-6-metoxy-1,4-benzoquinol methylase